MLRIILSPCCRVCFEWIALYLSSSKILATNIPSTLVRKDSKFMILLGFRVPTTTIHIVAGENVSDKLCDDCIRGEGANQNL